MKSFFFGAAVGATAIFGVWGIVHLTGEAPSAAGTLEAQMQPVSNPDVVELICELKLDVQGQLALGIKDEVPSRMTLAGIDFAKKSGWYQGKIAISESRAGILTVAGSKLHVVRPAMFERFGVVINREEFTIDRKTGSFQQTIGTKDGRIIPLISGTCAQVIKAPF